MRPAVAIVCSRLRKLISSKCWMISHAIQTILFRTVSYFHHPLENNITVLERNNIEISNQASE